MSIRKGTTIIAGNSSPLDWTGTLQEYNIALENGTIKENMVCYITDDTLYTDDIRPEIDRLDNIKANKDLSNLSEVGEKHFLNKGQITNCITEIPQRIKLELADGTLILKAGSEVIVPNGFEADGTTPKFDYVTIANDLTYKPTWGDGYKNFAIVTDNQTVLRMIRYDYVSSGATQPTPKGSGHAWYDTANNIVKRYDGTSWLNNTESFFIAEMTGGSDGIASIDQVFNGIGYIGSTIWVDKGVKGLIPNGRNEDGSLNNTEFVTNNVLIMEVSKNKTKPAQIRLRGASLQAGDLEYDLEANYNYLEGQAHIQENIRKLLIVGTYTSDADGKVTSLQPKLPFRAVDYNDIAGLKAYITETYVNGKSWYRVWSDGWCEQGGWIVLSGAVSATNKRVTFLKPYKITPSVYCSQNANAGVDNIVVGWEGTTEFSIGTVSGACTGGTNWYARGYIK